MREKVVLEASAPVEGDEAAAVGGGTPLLPLALALLVRLAVEVAEGEAPRVSEAVGEALTVLLAESVLLGVPVVVAVRLPEVLGVGARGGVAVPERLVEAVLEGEAPLVSVAVALALTVELMLTVELPLRLGLSVASSGVLVEAVVAVAMASLPLLLGDTAAPRGVCVVVAPAAAAAAEKVELGLRVALLLLL